ncbi:MAG: alpha/beta hydrolase, partial [Paenibacillaceae bacterium]|nr:alpha/beta hydrolase [Paenibacillaceae bacterium]
FRRSLNRRETYHPPKQTKSRYRVHQFEVSEYPVFTIKPKSMAHINNRRLLYLHGGAYVHEMSPFHWRFAGKLTEALGGTTVIPMYPLATATPASVTLSFVTDVYQNLLRDADSNDIVLIGDSAGGGMALALTQHIRNLGLPQPGHTLLFSPWLDVTLSHPEIQASEARDPLLARTGLLEAGKLYAGELDPRQPWVSPIYGSLTGLGPITIFYGTDELMLPDARQLVQQARADGVSIQAFEYPGMFHAWPIFPIPEASKVIRQVEFYLKEARGD